MRYCGAKNIGVQHHDNSDDGSQSHRVPYHKTKNDSLIAHLLGGSGGTALLIDPAQQLSQARSLVSQDPKRVAQVLRGWVGTDG